MPASPPSRFVEEGYLEVAWSSETVTGILVISEMLLPHFAERAIAATGRDGTASWAIPSAISPVTEMAGAMSDKTVLSHLLE